MPYAYTDADEGTNGMQWRDADGLRLLYGDHYYMRYAVWPPDNTPQTTAPWPLFIWVHGGGVNSPFDAGASAGYLPPGGTTAIYSNVTAVAGCCMVSIEYAPGSFGNPRLAFPEQGFFPTQVEQLARAIQFFRDHHDDEDIWGVGKSIDPNKVIVGGTSQGAIHALLLALQPEGWYDSDPDGITSGSPIMERFGYYADHRPNAVWADEPAIDFTQASSPLVAASGATGGWTSGTLRLNQTGAFSSYTYTAGDVVRVSGGSLSFTEATYGVTQKISDDEIELASSPGADATGVVFQVERGGLEVAKLWFSDVANSIDDVHVERRKAASAYWLLDNYASSAGDGGAMAPPKIPLLVTHQDLADTLGWANNWTPGVPNYRWNTAHMDKPGMQELHNQLQAVGWHTGQGTAEDVQTFWGGSGDGQLNGAQIMSTTTKQTALLNWLQTHVLA